ncbi:hypothetical protein [Sphaerisporangium sp. TRM90804]|uniref:hypothetical protein n=1 Tax=Sphaerisporangium sp. TRM90804 TaxID=3031113 RepID=UPI00244B5E80|nr:hypothetical protein [Sphaerisporangium sp. TRM90804]MDH2429333.1 hypothetical protein [Sphaerisporangium sp. TRM90804]
MNIDLVYADLDNLRSSLPQLRAALVPGTPRRWSQHDLTDEARARADALAVAEREAKHVNMGQGLKSLGDGRAPLSLSVLDVLADIEAAVVDLEAAVVDRLGQTRLAGASPAERITRLVGLLDRIAATEDLAEHVADEAHRMKRQARRALGDVEPVHRLAGRCPICDGMSLRAMPERELVVCVNVACRCNTDECPCNATQPRRHRWLYNEWPWLAQLLADDLENA